MDFREISKILKILKISKISKFSENFENFGFSEIFRKISEILGRENLENHEVVRKLFWSHQIYRQRMLFRRISTSSLRICKQFVRIPPVGKDMVRSWSQKSAIVRFSTMADWGPGRLVSASSSCTKTVRFLGWKRRNVWCCSGADDTVWTIVLFLGKI